MNRARLSCAALTLSALWAAAGCGAVKSAALKNVAGTLSSGGSSTLMTDDDPELIRGAVPFGLKLYESLLESLPKHVPLLVTTCSGYTGYAYAFLETDAALLDDEHHDEIVELRSRAVNMYLRAKGFCMRAMEIRYPITEPLEKDPKAALARSGQRGRGAPLLDRRVGAAMSLRRIRSS